MKEFFKKIWAWVLKNKVVSIVIASVASLGIVCAIALPIALKHKHDFKGEYTPSDTEHTRHCECGEKETNPHNSSEEYFHSDTHHWHECTECGYELSVESHTDSAFSKDDTHHWKHCTVCGEDYGKVAHVYNKQVATAEYLKTPATHTTKAIYYMSCECGAKGTETFESGETVAHNHSEDWKHNETSHWHECECGDKKDIANHTHNLEIINEHTLKAEATETTKAQYYKSCECGHISETEYFEVEKIATTITIDKNIDKVYDGKQVEFPNVKSNSYGMKSYAWYDSTNQPISRPKDAGTYTLKISIKGTPEYTAYSETHTFVISQKPISVIKDISVNYSPFNGTTRTVTLNSNTGVGICGSETLQVELTLNNVNVGAGADNVTGVTLKDGTYSKNYTVEGVTVESFEITPHVLSTGDILGGVGTLTFNNLTPIFENDEWWFEFNPNDKNAQFDYWQITKIKFKAMVNGQAVNSYGTYNQAYFSADTKVFIDENETDNYTLATDDLFVLVVEKDCTYVNLTMLGTAPNLYNGFILSGHHNELVAGRYTIKFDGKTLAFDVLSVRVTEVNTTLEISSDDKEYLEGKNIYEANPNKNITISSVVPASSAE